MRTTAPNAALVATGRSRLPRALHRLALASPVAEVIIDKLPFTPSRLRREALAGRLAASSLAGAQVAGASGAAVSAGGALGGALGGYHLRRRAGQALPVPDALLGALEDALAGAVAVQAVRLGASGRH